MTHMIWNNYGGFRIPDAMEVEWVDSAGETIRGEIETTAEWERTEKDNLRFPSQTRKRTAEELEQTENSKKGQH